MDTSSYHHRSRRPDQAGLEARIKAICETRVRYGYRRVRMLLQREGWRINIKKTHRVYTALGLQLRNKTPKRRGKASCAKTAVRPPGRTRPGSTLFPLPGDRPRGRSGVDGRDAGDVAVPGRPPALTEAIGAWGQLNAPQRRQGEWRRADIRGSGAERRAGSDEMIGLGRPRGRPGRNLTTGTSSL